MLNTALGLFLDHIFRGVNDMPHGFDGDEPYYTGITSYDQIWLARLSMLLVLRRRGIPIEVASVIVAAWAHTEYRRLQEWREGHAYSGKGRSYGPGY